MKKFELREIGKDWDSDGTLISTHNSMETAEKRMNEEASKKVKKVYYVRDNLMKDGSHVYDYGLYNRFLKIKVVENNDNNL